MATIWEKLTNFGGAAMHQLFDTVTEGWDVPKLKQYIRDVEKAEGEMVENLSQAQGAVAVTRKNIERRQTRIAGLEADITDLLTNDNGADDTFAAPLGEKIAGFRVEIEALERRLENERRIEAQMQQALAMLREKLVEKREQVRELEFAAEQAESMDSAADALEDAMGVLDGGDVASIDSLSDKVERQQAAAMARFDNLARPAEGLTGAKQALQKSRGMSEVERIRAQIEARKAAGGSAAE